MRRKFWILSWSCSHGSLEVEWYLFGSLLDQFVGRFYRAHGLSTFRFDAVWFIDFSAKILVGGFNGLGTIILSLISDNPSSIWFILEFMLLLCQFWISKRFARSLSFLACLMMVISSEDLQWFRLKIRSVRILDTTVCSPLEYWIQQYVRILDTTVCSAFRYSQNDWFPNSHVCS